MAHRGGEQPSRTGELLTFSRLITPAPQESVYDWSKGDDPDFIDWLHSQQCVVCEFFHMRQESPTEVHHCFHDRFSTKRTPDYYAIPLCNGCHTGFWDTSKLAIHNAKETWRKRYGPDFGYSLVMRARYEGRNDVIDF